ncbi:MAG: dihydrolipoyllysine-residue succinyltransferase [Chlamydiales bacterium]
MKEEIKVPPMGESINQVEIGRLLKPSGSFVTKEEEIIELETEKVNQVLYASVDGRVDWEVKEGDTVRIGDLLGYINYEENSLDLSKKNCRNKDIESTLSSKDESIPPSSLGQGERHMQEEFIANVTQDPKTEAKEVRIDHKNSKEIRRDMSKIRRTIAERLVEALHSTAMLTTFNEVNMSAIIDLRAKYKELFLKKHGVKIGFLSFFIKAVVEALKIYPDLNSYIDGNEIVQRRYFNIGVAVSTEQGLFVPVLKECDRLSFPQIEQKIDCYAKKAREGKLSIEDLSKGGFTITNGGVYGSLFSTPILNPPQVGILGMHAIQHRPIAMNGKIMIQPMMYLALSYDHRLIDGKEAIMFLMQVKEILEDPSRLLLIETDEKI